MTNSSHTDLPSRLENPADFFDKKFSAPNPWHLGTSKFEHRKYLRQIYALREFACPNTILELGSAEGVFTSLLVTEFPTATIDAVEISRLATERAKVSLQEASDRVTIHCQDIGDFLAHSLPQRWDAVVWSESLHYVARSRTAMEFFELIRLCVNVVSSEGYLCSVNTTKGITKPYDLNTIDCLRAAFRLLHSRARCRMWCEYVDYKPEEKCSWEYQLWLFQTP